MQYAGEPTWWSGTVLSVPFMDTSLDPIDISVQTAVEDSSEHVPAITEEVSPSATQS